MSWNLKNVIQPADNEQTLLSTKQLEESTKEEENEDNKRANKNVNMQYSEAKTISIEMKPKGDSDNVIIVSVSEIVRAQERSTSNEFDQKTPFFRFLKTLFRFAIKPTKNGRVDSSFKDILRTFIKNEQNHVFCLKTSGYNAKYSSN